MAVGLQYLFLTLDKSNNYTWLRLIKLYKDKVCSSFNWARSSILAAAGPCNSPVMTLMENSSPTQSEADWPIERGLPGVFSGHLRTVFTSDWLESLGNKKLMCIGAVRAPAVEFSLAHFIALHHNKGQHVRVLVDRPSRGSTGQCCDRKCLLWITTLMSLTSSPCRRGGSFFMCLHACLQIEREAQTLRGPTIRGWNIWKKYTGGKLNACTRLSLMSHFDSFWAE